MHMDKDLNVKDAFDSLYRFLRTRDIKSLTPAIASGLIRGFQDVDQVLQVIF